MVFIVNESDPIDSESSAAQEAVDYGGHSPAAAQQTVVANTGTSEALATS